MAKSHSTDGVPDRTLMVLNLWPEGSIGYRQEAELITTHSETST